MFSEKKFTCDQFGITAQRIVGAPATQFKEAQYELQHSSQTTQIELNQCSTKTPPCLSKKEPSLMSSVRLNLYSSPRLLAAPSPWTTPASSPFEYVSICGCICMCSCFVYMQSNKQTNNGEAFWMTPKQGFDFA